MKSEEKKTRNEDRSLANASEQAEAKKTSQRDGSEEPSPVKAGTYGVESR